MDEIKQHLETLGLGPDATPAEATQAYHDLMMVWHPDRFPANSRLQRLAQERAKQINLAYDKLKAHWNDPLTSESSSDSGPRQYQPRETRAGERSAPHEKGTSPSTRPVALGILAFAVFGIGCFAFSMLAGFEPPFWPTFVAALFFGIAVLSIAKVRKNVPEPTFWNYVKTFATTAGWVLIGFAVVAAFCMNAGREKGKDST